MGSTTYLASIRLARAPLVAFLSMGVLWGAYAALVPDTKAMLQANDAQFGSLMLATPIAAVVAMLLAPRIAPHMGHHVLAIAVLAMGLAFMVPGWMHRQFLFAIAMVLTGASTGFLDVTMTARVSGIETRHGLHLMNLTHAAYSLGYAVAAIATGIARSLGASPGEVLTVAGLVVAVSAALALERDDDARDFASRRPRGQSIGMVPFWGGLIVLIAFTAENAAENWSALHIERTLGGSKAEGSFGPALLALTMTVGRIGGQALIARLSEYGLLRGGAVITALGLALAALAPTTMVAYLGLVVMGLGCSVLVPTAFALIGRLSPAALRTDIIARATALGYMGYFFGPPVLGLVSEGLGLPVAFLGVAAVVMLVTVLVPLLIASGMRERFGADPG